MERAALTGRDACGRSADSIASFGRSQGQRGSELILLLTTAPIRELA